MSENLSVAAWLDGSFQLAAILSIWSGSGVYPTQRACDGLRADRRCRLARHEVTLCEEDELTHGWRQT